MKPLELQQWRKKHGYSQGKLSKELGVSRITIYRWEKAMRNIPTFLHLALECLKVKKGGESKTKGTKMKKRKEVRKHGKRYL
jgi:DNA-binding XRE family transcriptional regulator